LPVTNLPETGAIRLPERSDGFKMPSEADFRQLPARMLSNLVRRYQLAFQHCHQGQCRVDSISVTSPKLLRFHF